MSQKDCIILTGLKVSCIIGIFEWERKQKQDVVIDIKFTSDIIKASQHDRISDTVNYKKIAKTTISFVEKSRFQLIETLAEKLAQLLLSNFELEEIDLKVSKPGAIRGSQNVGIQIHRTRLFEKDSSCVFLSLGSNINPKKNLELALKEIDKKYGIIACSHVYKTSPVGKIQQPSFWNMVAAIRTNANPEQIRKWAHLLEKTTGRVKNKKTNDPRTLDLDLIIWKNSVKKSKAFSLPHPDIEKKAFVLFPLLEIHTGWIHPITKKSLIEIAAEFKDRHQKIKQLPSHTFPDFTPKTLKK